MLLLITIWNKTYNTQHSKHKDTQHTTHSQTNAHKRTHLRRYETLGGASIVDSPLPGG